MSRHSAINEYSSSVRVGKWNEELYLEEALLKDFIAKKENGQLLIQRIQNILDTFLKKTELSVTDDGFVHFGDKVMVVNPGQEILEVPLTQIKPARLPHSLSLNADESMLYYDETIKPPIDLSASRLLNPCKRNTWVITSVDGTPNGEKLCFGQPFTLASLPGYTSNLKLWSDHIRFNQRAKRSNKQLVNCVCDVDYMCVWNALIADPQQRLETEGLPVPANTKIVIHHCKTGEKLAMLDNQPLKTPFGRELEIVAETLLDPHNAEKDLNHWNFVTGNPPDSTETLTNRVKKVISEDDEVDANEKAENERKHWTKVNPEDEKPNPTFCCSNSAS